mmetsp:Transcript_110457/g.293423  ORF Transcript_110457/g.293423 Transcript_110457/m.293423 type:complete len:272 (+) Transcript_110457:30-845(+)
MVPLEPAHCRSDPDVHVHDRDGRAGGPPELPLRAEVDAHARRRVGGVVRDPELERHAVHHDGARGHGEGVVLPRGLQVAGIAAGVAGRRGVPGTVHVLHADAGYVAQVVDRVQRGRHVDHHGVARVGGRRPLQQARARLVRGVGDAARLRGEGHPGPGLQLRRVPLQEQRAGLDLRPVELRRRLLAARRGEVRLPRHDAVEEVREDAGGHVRDVHGTVLPVPQPLAAVEAQASGRAQRRGEEARANQGPRRHGGSLLSRRGVRYRVGAAGD